MVTAIALAPAGAAGGPGGAEHRLLGCWQTTGRADLATHLEVYGPLPSLGSRWRTLLPGLLDRAQLTGRGGGGFPAARKLRAVAVAQSSVLVVNAMEGEPASTKDFALLTCAPHLVLDGAFVAAAALGSDRIVVCVAADRDRAAAAVEHALAERRSGGLATIPVEIARPPAHYVAGEESALVNWLGHRTSLPVFRPDKAVGLVVGRRLALVHNAETVAHMALIARAADVAAVDIGPATTLITLSGALSRPGVIEVELGTPLKTVIAGGRPDRPLQAALVGGFAGGWVHRSAFAAPLSSVPLRELGASIGAGVVVALGADECGVAATARIARYMAGESAGQCGPCVFGLPAIAADLERLTNGTAGSGIVERLSSHVGFVDGRGGCGHPDGVARLVRSALNVFAADVANHGAGDGCLVRSGGDRA